MTSPFAGLREGINQLIAVKEYNQRQERLDADRAAQKEMRDLQMSQLRRQEGEAKRAAENLELNRGLAEGMAGAGYDPRTMTKAMENQAMVTGDFDQASKLNEERKKLEKEGAYDTIRLARAGDLKGAVAAYNSVGDDKVESFEFDPDDKTRDTLIYVDPMGKTGKVKISQVESLLVDPADAMKARAAQNKLDAETAAKIKIYKETRGAMGLDGGDNLIPVGGMMFDLETRRYLPPPRGLGVSRRGGGASGGDGLTEAQIRENEAIRNARIMVKNKRILRSDPRLDKNSPEFDPTLVDVVTLANRTYYGGDPAARAFAGGARSPEKVWGNKGLGMPQKPEERKPFQAKPMASDQLPDRAVAQLKPGANTAFANGQVWTIRDGQPVRVK